MPLTPYRYRMMCWHCSVIVAAMERRRLPVFEHWRKDAGQRFQQSEAAPSIACMLLSLRAMARKRGDNPRNVLLEPFVIHDLVVDGTDAPIILARGRCGSEIASDMGAKECSALMINTLICLKCAKHSTGGPCCCAILSNSPPRMSYRNAVCDEKIRRRFERQ